MTQPLVLEFLVVLANEVSADACLEVGHDLRQAFISHVLQSSEHACLEEDLGVPQTIVILIHLQSTQNLLSDDFAVHETRRNHVRRQDRISANTGNRYV